jgi:hypothetical protein
MAEGTEPVGPEAPGPGVSVERAHGENAPLLCLPCRVEPKGLSKHPEDTRPPAPGFAFVLRKPNRNDAAKGNADLI